MEKKITSGSSNKRTPARRKITHICTQEEQIARITKLLVGNGKPEDGYVYKVMELSNKTDNINKIVDDQSKKQEDFIESTKNKLSAMNGVLIELHEESITRSAVGKNIKSRRNEFIKVAGIIIAAVSLVGTLIFSYLNNKTSSKTIQTSDVIEKKIDNLGTPVIVNNRGEYTKLPQGDSLKYYRNGKFENITNQKDSQK